MQYLVFYVLFLTLLAQKILSFSTYSQEELLDKEQCQLTNISTRNMTFPKRILYLVHHPGQWIGSQPATQNNVLQKGQTEQFSGQAPETGTSRTAPEYTTRQCPVS